MKRRTDRRVLTPAAAVKAKEMYEEVDVRGRRIHSCLSIGAALGVSETTIYRVLNNFGAYMAVPEPATGEEIAESQARMLKMLNSDEMLEELKPEVPKALTEAMSKLDGAAAERLRKLKGE